MKFDVVVATKNSGNTLEDTLISIKEVFEDYLNEIIIVDGGSIDKTIEIAKKFECRIIYCFDSLGESRKKGALISKTDYIFFIDSDIILNKKWLKGILRVFLDKSYNPGMIFGYTLSLNKLDVQQKKYRMKKRFKKTDVRKLRKGERGYTHNTIVIRDIFNYIDFKDVYSWEDYIITKNIIDSGLEVYEINEYVKHNHNEDIYNVERWNFAGYRNVIGLNPYFFKKIIFNFLWGIFCSFKFRNIRHLFMNIMIIKSNIYGYIFYRDYMKKGDLYE